MPLNLCMWEITEEGPARLEETRVDLEQQLEVWIERDPSMVQPGIVIVGRQFPTPAGPIDLLGLDPIGRWNVIEIKRGNVRRETIGQALDYAACISQMDAEELASKVNAYLARRPGNHGSIADLLNTANAPTESTESARDVDITVVGTGRDAGLERMVEFLGRQSDLSISVVTFGVFNVGGARQVLLRELTEADETANQIREFFSVDAVLARARKAGIIDDFQIVFDALVATGLPYRPTKAAIVFGAPSARSRCLFSIDSRPTRNGHLAVYLNAKTIENYLGIPAAEVEQALKGNGYLELEGARVGEFAEAVLELVRPAMVSSS